MKTRNYVQKHSLEFNHSRVYLDKKKALKRGKIKHKGKNKDD